MVNKTDDKSGDLEMDIEKTIGIVDRSEYKLLAIDFKGTQPFEGTLGLEATSEKDAEEYFRGTLPEGVNLDSVVVRDMTETEQKQFALQTSYTKRPTLN